MTTVGDTVRYISDIYDRHGKPRVRRNMTPNRAAVKKPGFLVHAVKITKDPKRSGGVLNGFSADGKIFAMTRPGGDKAAPYIDPYETHAFWAKLREGKQVYTFMGVFKADPASTDALRIYNRIDDKYDPRATDMAITRFV
jgi:hypothetical protein